jgi:hypothetical protein
LPERAVDREREQNGQVLEDPIADHDRLIARVDANVYVQAESYQPARSLLKELNQAVVALVGCDNLILPGRKGMRGPPKNPEVVATGDLADYLEVTGQVSLNFGDVFANFGVQLDATLKELGFDRALELRRDFAQNLGSAAAQGHGAAVDENELDLDTERRPGVADESVRDQGQSLRE